MRASMNAVLSKVDGTVNYLKIAVAVMAWMAPVVFAAGASYKSVHDQEKRLEIIELLAKDMARHLTIAEVKTIEFDDMKKEVASNSTYINARFERMDRNILALCIASRGAQCAR